MLSFSIQQELIHNSAPPIIDIGNSLHVALRFGRMSAVIVTHPCQGSDISKNSIEAVVEGKRYPIVEAPPRMAAIFMSRLKMQAGLDIASKTTPGSGSFEYSVYGMCNLNIEIKDGLETATMTAQEVFVDQPEPAEETA
jgi:hypothetical protein